MEGAGLQQSLIGATIGNYRVVAKLGEGGMGSVYLAEHPLIGKKVALKVLHEEYSANQDVVSRFFNEAKAVNDIGHPNIVDIIDYGVVQTQSGPGFVYFIMEFLGGEALASLIQREAPIPPDRAFAIAVQVADALAASHQKGIIHRDLKPDNIYLIQRGRDKDFVKVLDFGIAKLTGDGGGSRRTRTGIVMGTPAYMSPEQCEGKGNIDARTDVYALGIVLYELITGRVPFAGEGYGEVLVQHLTKRPERPTTVLGAVPPLVEAVVMKSLEKKRDDRYQNMDDFIAALRDPQGYVDAHGGLAQFYSPDGAGSVVGQSGAMRPGQARTPYPVAVATPGLGSPRPKASIVGATGLGLAPAGVGAGAVSGSAADEPIAMPRSKTPFIVAGAVLLLGGIGAAVALRGGKSSAPAAKAPTPAMPAQPVAPPPVEPVVPKPAEPQPATPVEPVSTNVVIKITSEPSGALVFVAGEAKERGRTPLDVTLERGDGQADLVFRLDGYKEKKRTVLRSRDAEIEIALDKERRTPVASGTKPGTGTATKPGQGKGTTPGADDVLAPKF
jgi:serine/threonine-protein kinase